MRFKQHLGIVGAICSSLLVSYGAIAQTANPTTPSAMDTADMERICAEYMNMNGTQAQQRNSSDSTIGDTATGTTTPRNMTGNTARETSGTTTPRNMTGNTDRETRGTTTAPRNNAMGATPGRVNGTSARRDATGNTPMRTSGTTSASRQGVESFTAEQLDSMCANLRNNSDSNSTRPSSTTPSVNPGNTDRPTQRPPVPNQ